MKKNAKLILSIILLFVVLILFFIFFCFEKDKKTEIEEEIPMVNDEIDYQKELNKIKKQYDNNDIVGILSIENTSFNEIVMQYIDNDYYLEHTVYHENNWRGQTFLDYRMDINNSKKLIIYGHNSNSYNLPFKIFENYYNSSYLNEHKYLYLQTDKGIKKYEIFSVYVEASDWGYFSKIKFTNDDEYYNHILELKNKSFYDTGVNITKDSEILIIQTCSYHYDYRNYENKFLLIMGKLLV